MKFYIIHKSLRTEDRIGFRKWRDSHGKKLCKVYMASGIGKEGEQLTYESWILKEIS